MNANFLFPSQIPVFLLAQFAHGLGNQAGKRVFVLENEMKLIALTHGKFAKVDDSDYELLVRYNWRYDNGYASRTEKFPIRKTVRMHNQIMGTPTGMETDHKDLDKTNNQRHNLRICTFSQNNANTNVRKDNTSGYKGVQWYKPYQKWRARLGDKHLGYFSDKESAARAYDKKAREIFGEFARVNFP
jgi:hypothetical protein